MCDGCRLNNALKVCFNGQKGNSYQDFKIMMVSICVILAFGPNPIGFFKVRHGQKRAQGDQNGHGDDLFISGRVVPLCNLRHLCHRWTKGPSQLALGSGPFDSGQNLDIYKSHALCGSQSSGKHHLFSNQLWFESCDNYDLKINVLLTIKNA